MWICTRLSSSPVCLSYPTINNMSTISYTDTGLTNGTEYYYVVSALNNGVEGANSSPEVVVKLFSPPSFTSVSPNTGANNTLVGPFSVYGTGFLTSGINRIGVGVGGGGTVTITSGTVTITSDTVIDTGASLRLYTGVYTVYYSTDNGFTQISTGLTVTIT